MRGKVRARGLEPPRACGPTGPKPAASTSSATPARPIKDRDAGYHSAMATPEERERESRESEHTKFEEASEEVEREQREAAEKIAEPLEPRDDDDS
jgi:hypothetical protein